MTVLNLALSFLGVLPILGGVWFYLQRFRRGRHVLHFSSRSPIDLILTTSTVAPAEHGVRVNRPLTGYGQVRAVASCARTLASLYPRKDVNIHLSGFIRQRPKGDVVVLGGPAKNEEARAFLRDFLRNHDLAKFNFDDENDTLEIASHDNESFDCHNFLPEIIDGYPTTDYGLVIATYKDESDRRRRYILCAGFTTYGTAAAAEYLFGDMVKLSRWRFAKRAGINPLSRSRAFVVVVWARFSQGEYTELRQDFQLNLKRR